MKPDGRLVLFLLLPSVALGRFGASGAIGRISVLAIVVVLLVVGHGIQEWLVARRARQLPRRVRRFEAELESRIAKMPVPDPPKVRLDIDLGRPRAQTEEMDADSFAHRRASS